MSESRHEQAQNPEDLGRLFVERANAGDVEGLVALFEPGGAMALPGGQLVEGRDALRDVFAQLLANVPAFTPGEQRPALRVGELALTSTRMPGSATAEIARQQADGSWLWVADVPDILA